MENNINNFFGTALDKGSMTGPILEPLDESTMDKISWTNQTLETRANTEDFWLSSLGSAGQVSIATSTRREPGH